MGHGVNTTATATATTSTALSLTSLGCMLSYFFDPCHRVVNLLEIALYNNCYDCTTYLLPIRRSYLEHSHSESEIGTENSGDKSVDTSGVISTLGHNHNQSHGGVDNPSGRGEILLDWQCLLITALLSYFKDSGKSSIASSSRARTQTRTLVDKQLNQSYPCTNRRRNLFEYLLY